MDRREDLDVLRFLAVTGVVLYHVGLPGTQNGFIGVDVFFVLSGFLIMKSILRDRQQDCFSLSKFLERRARRLVPALLLVLMLNIPIFFLVFSPEDIEQTLTSYLSILLFTPNFYFWSKSGYFDLEAKQQAFLHTWSLGIEIQFYLLLGISLSYLFRYSNEKSLITILKVLSLGSFTLSTISAFWKPGVNFFLLPTRIWEFGIGSITAIWFSKVKADRIKLTSQKRLKNFGLTVIVCCLLFPIRLPMWPSALTIIPVFGAVLVLAFPLSTKLTKPILDNRLLSFLGKVSYGWFLWHWPIIVYANYISDNQVSVRLLTFLSLLTLLIAILQWHFFEKKFQDSKRLDRQKFQRSMLTSTAAIATIAALGVVSNGFDSIWRQTRFFSTEKKVLELYLSRNVESQVEALNSYCKFSVRSTDELDSRAVENCVENFGPAIVVIGDSHGVVFQDILARSNLRRFVIGLATPGSRPSNGIFGQYADILNYVERHNDIVDKVFFMQSGSYLLEDRFGNVDSNLVFQEEEVARVSKINVKLTVDYLIQLSELANLTWIGPYSQSRINVSNPSNWYALKRISPHVVKIFETLDLYLFEVSKQNQIAYVSSINQLKFPHHRLLSENCIVWRDQDHISKCGRELLAKRTISFLEELASRK
jgi:peptidoglycan/LPS O-acetylase OafA/YrhL